MFDELHTYEGKLIECGRLSQDENNVNFIDGDIKGFLSNVISSLWLMYDLQYWEYWSPFPNIFLGNVSIEIS